jgi:hypothetical protein
MSDVYQDGNGNGNDRNTGAGGRRVRAARPRVNDPV